MDGVARRSGAKECLCYRTATQYRPIHRMVAASRLLFAVNGSRFLQHGNPFPATRIVNHQTKIVDHDLSRESGVAFIAIGVLGNPCVALREDLHPKLRKLDPCSSDRLTLADAEVKTPDGESIGCRRDREINVKTATDFGQILPQTVPHAGAIRTEAECLRVSSNRAFYLHSLCEPVAIATYFVFR